MNVNDTQQDHYDKFGLMHFSLPGMPKFPSNSNKQQSEFTKAKQ